MASSRLDEYANWGELKQKLIDDVSDFSSLLIRKAGDDIIRRLAREGLRASEIEKINGGRIIQFKPKDNAEFEKGKIYFEKVVGDLGTDWLNTVL